MFDFVDGKIIEYSIENGSEGKSVEDGIVTKEEYGVQIRNTKTDTEHKYIIAYFLNKINIFQRRINGFPQKRSCIINLFSPICESYEQSIILFRQHIFYNPCWTIHNNYTPSYCSKNAINPNAKDQFYKAVARSLQAPSLLKAHLCEVRPKPR